MKDMKKIITILTILLILPIFPFKVAGAAVLQEEEPASGSDPANMTKVVIGRDLVTVEDSDSGLKVRILDNDISILESLEEKRKTEVDEKVTVPEDMPVQEEAEPLADDDVFSEEDNELIYERETGNKEYYRYERDRLNERDERERDSYRSSRYFRGHLSGVNLGFNGYLYDGYTEMPEEISYMETNTGKSLGGSLFFAQADIGLTRHAGFVTGAGITWNNYFFRWHNSIGEGDDGTIIETIPGESATVKRSKFATLYLEVPFLLEIQIPAGYSRRLNVSAGVIGGLKLNAWTKTVFKDGEKTRSNGDYNLNLLRGGATARVGFENFMLYGTCYLTPWFHDSKGPSGLNPVPFEIGLSFTVND